MDMLYYSFAFIFIITYARADSVPYVVIDGIYNDGLQVELSHHSNRVKREDGTTTSSSTTSTTSSTTATPTTTTTTTTATPAVTDMTTVAMTTESTTTTPKPTPMTFPPNSTIINDTHTYYTQHVQSHQHYFVERSKVPNHVKHPSLDDKHRTAAKTQLGFTFSFYGHDLDQVTIATGGFIYMSNFMHPWLTATQYVAPLMANFDTKLGNDSDIYYADTGTEFIVWWENLYLQDDRGAGPFTFQAQLIKPGTIVFAYKNVPKSVEHLSTDEHPVKVGLSDAYYYDEKISDYMSRRTIYEYHRVEVDLTVIASGHSVLLQPVPTCNMLPGCKECINTQLPGFTCKYCPSIKHCGDGPDRRHQDWLDNDCNEEVVSEGGDCSSGSDVGWKVAVAFTVIIILLIIGGVVGWVFYAYNNPNSSGGRWLIEHRPSQIGRAIAQKARFWKKNDPHETYGVSVGNESVA